MNPHNKSKMLHTYNKFEWQFHIDFFLMQSMWDPNMQGRSALYNGVHHYLLDCRRDNILEDSLQKLVQVKLVNGRDPLKQPIMIRFTNEPGIDEGGLRKEYFHLIMKEIISQQYGMFIYNEDVQLYWINGMTFEMNINFELVGILMGIAIYNNTFIDMPFPSAAYKLLLNEEPTLEDLAQWQPELAKSFVDVLNYDE